MKKLIMWLKSVCARRTAQYDWANKYALLDKRYNISGRGVDLALFLSNPEHYTHWITFWFTNQALLKDRIALAFFITNDPAHLVKAVLTHQQFTQRLCCVSQVSNSSEEDFMAQKPHAKQLRKVAYRGGRLIQPIMRHRINPRFKRAHG